MSAPPLPPDAVQSPGEIYGLSQAEAEARYVEGQDNSITFKSGRSRRDIVREAVFSVYTFDLLGVAVVFWLLEQPLGALYSLSIMLLLFGYNITTAFKAKEKLDALLELTRPEASVIRDGKLRAIDPNTIVPGDMVLVGPGDQFFADGRLRSDDPISVNETWLTGNLEARSLQENESVFAGSYCRSGHGVYEAELVGDNRRISSVLDTYGAAEQPKTPLQTIVYRVLMGLRILSLALGVYIILLFTFLESNPETRVIYENALSIILGLAPGGIYFMILLSYITGTSNLAGLGALAQRAEAVEKLAQTDVLCLGKAGTLTGTLVEFEPLEESGDADIFSQSHVQHILGDFARSTRSRSKLILAMKESFDGTRRGVKEDALFLSLAGWQGVAFADDDLEGTFVLGLETALDGHLDWWGIERPPADSQNLSVPLNSHLSRFIFAYSPMLDPLRAQDGRPLLPEQLQPLGYLLFSEETRPEARETTSAFSEAGIALKVLSSQKVERVLQSAEAVGLSQSDESPPQHISGPDLATLSAAAYADAVARAEVFGLLTPEQKGDIVRALQAQGALVSMVGDSVADLPGQRDANLTIAFRDSNQAALSSADVILLDDTLQALPSILAVGQAVFNRLLDVLRLALTHATTAVLLTIVALLLGAKYFPYLPAQNSTVAILTITIPSIGLAFWPGPGKVQTSSLGRRLAFFILPAGISTAVMVLIIHILLQQLTGDIVYSRVVVTHILVGSGLLLVFFVQPPSEFWVGAEALSGDRRLVVLVIVLWFLFILLTLVPFTSRELGLQPLWPPVHYLIVMAVLAVWVLALRTLWRAQWFRRLTGMTQLDEVKPPWLSSSSPQVD